MSPIYNVILTFQCNGKGQDKNVRRSIESEIKIRIKYVNHMVTNFNPKIGKEKDQELFLWTFSFHSLRITIIRILNKST